MGAGGATRALTLLAAATLLAACHDVPASKGTGRQHLPGSGGGRNTHVTDIPPGPALLETIDPYHFPKSIKVDGDNNHQPWQSAFARLDRHHKLIWRVPYEWPAPTQGRAGNGDPRARIQVTAAFTTVRSGELALATYAAELADNEPIWRLVTPSGDIAYITRREVSVAPSDPQVESVMFHTAVLDIDGRVAKLEIRYDPHLRWRFEELSHAVLGTVDVRRS